MIARSRGLPIVPSEFDVDDGDGYGGKRAKGLESLGV